MNDKVVIAGTVKLRNTIKAKTNLHNVINGTPSWVVNTGGGGIVYPHYSGSYTVTPSGSVQVLDTSDTIMDDDVTVEAIQAGSATTPATIITADPTISVSSGGLITATVSKTQQITPTVQEGYVETGTPGNVGVSGSNTQQLSTQGAQTIYPSANDQSIASGKYLTGNQTFKAVTVSGLTADKVLQGNVVKIGDADDDDRIMSVTGTASGGITPTGTKSITANGTGIDVYSYQYADVAVPNSYSAGDEGKVVSNGALVAQTSDTVTANNTYDTTLINSLTVNVSGGGDINALINGSITTVTTTESTVRAGAFMACSSLTSATLTNASTIEGYTFYGCTSLTSISVPSATQLKAAYNFYNVPATSVIFPSVTSISGGNVFNGAHISTLVFPALATTSTNAFNSTSYLTTVDFGDTYRQMGSGSFNGTANVNLLILRKADACVTLSNVNSMNATKFKSDGAGGTIYIPKALYDHLGDGTSLDYKAATNWSTVNGYGTITWAKIEGSYYETHYADGTVIA